MSVGQTILQQLGGNRFIAMTGAKNFVRCDKDNWLQFKLPSKPHYTKNKINCVKITLTPADLYSVEFMYIRGLTVKSICTIDGVYANMLQRVFTDATGLDTHL